ncbi:serine/threonine-protein kinase ATM isoform X2 [Drosophila grimshawi]|uniref:serine/threonine-protein kinase ATM isoform X2 n=1 Tax=Drosophila grimshawi TaxID=7222 RepID=UPI000C870802|nr:serine/threonine-protein kinase ATM isoform X2 [Drosophila grimshawi]
MLEHFFECAASEVKGVYQDKRVVKQFPYICECIRIVNCVPINLCNVVKVSYHCQGYLLGTTYVDPQMQPPLQISWQIKAFKCPQKWHIH